ncbi:MAG: hypothetical protein AB199_00145 [Parcubacteria bacterium C7867-004]|nr:MAG: hypothetical protein AB199_00145 [Parcubacteria bacterium C7867-004]
MNTLGKTLTESAAILLVGLAIVGSLMYAFSQNTQSYGQSAAYGQSS